MGRRPWRSGVVAVGLAVGLAVAGPAVAGGTLPSGAVVSSTTPQTFSYQTSTNYWSVVADVPSSGADFPLSLLNVAGAQLAHSDAGAGKTSFVAVDSNSGTEPYGTYYAQVSQSVAGTYWIQAQYGAHITTIPSPTHQGTTGAGDPDIAFVILQDNSVVTISDIYLTAGQSFWATTPVANTDLYLLEATPGQPSTYIQSRAHAAASQNTKVIDNCTLYTAGQTGWHALVFVGDAPVTGNSQQGIAIGLHQYDATQPNYCPMADFPGPTP